MKEVKSLTKTIQDLGNPFAYKSQDCVYWIQKKHYREGVIKPMRTAQELGKKQFDNYVEKSLKQETEPIVHKEKHHTTV